VGGTGRIYALDAATARLLWKHDLKGEPAPPRLADGVLYVGTDTEVLYALQVGPAAPPGSAVPSAVPSRSVTSAPVPTRLPQRTPGPPPTNGQDHRTTGPAKKKPSKSSRPPKATTTRPPIPTPRPTTTPTDPPVTTPGEPGDGG
jgi:hypothetical protein